MMKLYSVPSASYASNGTDKGYELLLSGNLVYSLAFAANFCQRDVFSMQTTTQFDPPPSEGSQLLKLAY